MLTNVAQDPVFNLNGYHSRYRFDPERTCDYDFDMPAVIHNQKSRHVFVDFGREGRTPQDAKSKRQKSIQMARDIKKVKGQRVTKKGEVHFQSFVERSLGRGPAATESDIFRPKSITELVELKAKKALEKRNRLESISASHATIDRVLKEYAKCLSKVKVDMEF